MRLLNPLILLGLAFLASFSAAAQYVQPMRYDHYSVSQQMNVGSGTVRVTDPSAYLEVGPTSGGNKGFLVPRLSTAQRDAIASPATGLMVYNTSTNAFNFYNGSSWTTFSSGAGGSGITQLGNTGWGLLRINDSTYSADSSKLITKYQSEKSRDSLGSLIGTKFSTSDTASKWIPIGWLSLLMKYSDTASKTWDWGDITGRPSSLSGYGITDAIDSMRRIGGSTNVQARKNGVWVTQFVDSVGSGGGGGAPSGNYGNGVVIRNGALEVPGGDSLDFDAGLYIKGVLSATALPTGGADADSIVVINSSGAFKKRNVSAFARMNTTSAAGQLALFNGVGTLYSSSKFVFADASYPYMGMVGSDPLFYFGAISVNNPIIGSGAGLSLYGGDTYESINFYDKSNSGTMMARFYNSGGTISNLLNGLIISNTLSSPSNYQGSYTIQRTVPYAVTGLNYHGFTDQTDFRVGTNAFNSFGTFVKIGNNNTYQDHWAGFQAVFSKDSLNRLGKVYDFVSAVSEMKLGTIDSVYRFKVFELTKTGGTIVRQYGIQIDNLTSATTNVGAWIYNNVGIGPTAHTPSERLVVDGNFLGTGNIKTGDPGSGAGAWKLGTAVTTSGLTLNTTTYVEVSIGGTVYRLAVVDPPAPTPKP